MQIAELFVNLGLKGADQTGKALGGVKSSLGDVKSMSLEAKAAILAVVYGLEHLMSNSAQTGTALMNFNALTGMSAKSLQQWQYAARQAGVSGEELTGSMKGVQNVMANMLLGKGAPEGLAMVANKVGFDLNKARDTAYVMQQLQKFAQSVPQDVGNQMLKSFGVSEGTIAAMRRNMFTQENFAKAPTYSDKEVSTLNKVDVAWANLGQTVQMAIGHFTSKHGLSLVNDLAKATAEILKLANAFTVLADKIKLFDTIDQVFKGWGMIFQIIGTGIDKLTGFMGKQGKDNGLTDKSGNLKNNPVQMMSDWIGRVMDDVSHAEDIKKGYDVSPQMKPSHHNQSNNSTTINQSIVNHGVKDAHDVGHHVGKAMQKHINNAHRQYQANARGA